jgi:hypothetical protein
MSYRNCLFHIMNTTVSSEDLSLAGYPSDKSGTNDGGDKFVLCNHTSDLLPASLEAHADQKNLSYDEKILVTTSPEWKGE